MSDSEGGDQSDLGMDDLMYFMSGDSAEADEDDSNEANGKPEHHQKQRQGTSTFKGFFTSDHLGGCVCDS